MGGQQKKKQTKSQKRRKSIAQKPSKPIEIPSLVETKNEVAQELPTISGNEPVLETPKSDIITLDDSGIESVKDESTTTSSANSVADKNEQTSYEKIEVPATKIEEPEIQESSEKIIVEEQSKTEENEDLSETLKDEETEQREEGEIIEDTFTSLACEWKFCMNHKPAANMKKDASMPNIRRMSLSPELDEQIFEISKFNSVEGFWQIFSHLQPPANLNHKTKPNVYLFKTTSHPTWEHHTNVGGCQWACVIPRVKRSECLNLLWSEMVLALVGNTFPADCADFINGIAVQRRQKEDRIVLWAKDFENKEIQMKIGKHMKYQVFRLNKSNHLTCNKFDDSPKPVTKNSSFQYRSSTADTYIV